METKIAQMLDLLLPLAPELGQETSLAFHRPWNSEFGARNGVTFELARFQLQV